MRIGIDTGGTFTDFVFLGQGEGRMHKVPSQPRDPWRAIRLGLRELRPEGLAGVEVVHGTTVGTNAFLTRRGARVVLVTTQGFEDVFFIGRQTRGELFSLTGSKPPALLSREQVVGVKERRRADGSVLTALTADEVSRVKQRVAELVPEAVAVCLLHAYVNPEHEERLGAAFAELGVPLSLSSRVLPELREYERTSATVLNAYLSPVLARYLSIWERELPGAPLFIQQSNGGFLPARRAASWGLNTVLSGPAGGVLGAWRLARALGEKKILTLDMGGTSTDVALLAGGIPLTSEYLLEGYPLGRPVIDIHTVGAGGGSIAWRDQGGALRVGPASAGADPGPVCYGQGEALTVTDAQLYLGRLVPAAFLGGRMGLQVGATVRAVERLARDFNVAPEELALGIIRTANSHMAKALQTVSLERGHDPRDFTLCCFGGAGGLHVCELAQELGIRRIIMPAQAGVLSAWGMALAGHRRDLGRTLLASGAALTWERLHRAYQELKQQGLAELAADGVEPDHLLVNAELEMRYRGQSYRISVPLTTSFREDFQMRHQRLYGHAFPGREIEAVVMRLYFAESGVTEDLPVMKGAAAASTLNLPLRSRLRLPTGELSTTPLYYRPALEPGFTLAGPAVVAEEFATLFLLPGWQGKITPQGHMVVECP